MGGYSSSPTFPEDEMEIGAGRWLGGVGAPVAHLNSFFPGGAMGQPSHTHLLSAHLPVGGPGFYFLYSFLWGTHLNLPF